MQSAASKVNPFSINLLTIAAPPRLVLWPPSTLPGKLIAWQTDGRVSHAGLLYGGYWLLEATWPRVRIRPFFDESEGDSEAEIYALPPGDWSVANPFAMQQIGKRYDLLGLVRFLERGYRAKNPNPSSWFCSDLTFAICQKAGINLLERCEYWKVSPEGIRRSPAIARL